jgi:hypothetical protein
MPDATATRQNVLRLAETLKAYGEKCDNLSEQMTALQIQLAEQRGQAVPVKVESLEARVRQLEDLCSRLKGVVAIISFIGVGGIAAVLKLYAK